MEEDAEVDSMPVGTTSEMRDQALQAGYHIGDPSNYANVFHVTIPFLTDAAFNVTKLAVGGGSGFGIFWDKVDYLSKHELTDSSYVPVRIGCKGIDRNAYLKYGDNWSLYRAHAADARENDDLVIGSSKYKRFSLQYNREMTGFRLAPRDNNKWEYKERAVKADAKLVRALLEEVGQVLFDCGPLEQCEKLVHAKGMLELHPNTPSRFDGKGNLHVHLIFIFNPLDAKVRNTVSNRARKLLCDCHRCPIDRQQHMTYCRAGERYWTNNDGTTPVSSTSWQAGHDEERRFIDNKHGDVARMLQYDTWKAATGQAQPVAVATIKEFELAEAESISVRMHGAGVNRDLLKSNLYLAHVFMEVGCTDPDRIGNFIQEAIDEGRIPRFIGEHYTEFVHNKMHNATAFRLIATSALNMATCHVSEFMAALAAQQRETLSLLADSTSSEWWKGAIIDKLRQLSEPTSKSLDGRWKSGHLLLYGHSNLGKSRLLSVVSMVFPTAAVLQVSVEANTSSFPFDRANPRTQVFVVHEATAKWCKTHEKALFQIMDGEPMGISVKGKSCTLPRGPRFVLMATNDAPSLFDPLFEDLVEAAHSGEDYSHCSDVPNSATTEDDGGDGAPRARSGWRTRVGKIRRLRPATEGGRGVPPLKVVVDDQRVSLDLKSDEDLPRIAKALAKLAIVGSRANPRKRNLVEEILVKARQGSKKQFLAAIGQPH